MIYIGPLTVDCRLQTINMARIVNLSDLKTIDDEGVAKAFFENMEMIFQFALKDITAVLEEKQTDVLGTIRQELCDKMKNSFPEFHARRPINRKAKHLIVQDIFQLGYSLVNKSPTKEAEKAFEKVDIQINNGVDDDDGEGEDNTSQDIGEMARLLTTVANLQKNVNFLMKENNKLNMRLNALPPCKCACPAASTSGASASRSIGQDSNAGGDSIPSKAVDDFSLSDTGTETEEDESKCPNRTVSRKEKRHKNKAIKTRTPSHRQIKASSLSKSSHLKAAPIHSEYMQVYVGNVDPETSTTDVTEHIKQHADSVVISEIHDLYKGKDARSFRITVADSDFNKVINTPWPKGIKVRKFYPKKKHEPRKNSLDRSKKPSDPTQRVSAGKRDQNRYARHPNPQYYTQPSRFTPSYSPYSEYYESEWPSLPRPWRDHPWDDHWQAEFHEDYF